MRVGRGQARTHCAFTSVSKACCCERGEGGLTRARRPGVGLPVPPTSPPMLGTLHPPAPRPPRESTGPTSLGQSPPPAPESGTRKGRQVQQAAPGAHPSWKLFLVCQELRSHVLVFNLHEVWVWVGTFHP